MAASSAPFETWLAELLTTHRTLLARVARQEGLFPEDALDVVQDAFITFSAHVRAPALTTAPDDARKLLVAITRNLARNHRRKHAHARPHLADDGTLATLASEAPPADELLAAAETHARLEVCLARLADRQRVVVTMRLFDGQGGAEVGEALAISPGHVAILLHRARAALCACLNEAPSPQTDAPGAVPAARR